MLQHKTANGNFLFPNLDTTSLLPPFFPADTVENQEQLRSKFSRLPRIPRGTSHPPAGTKFRHAYPSGHRPRRRERLRLAAKHDIMTWVSRVRERPSCPRRYSQEVAGSAVFLWRWPTHSGIVPGTLPLGPPRYEIAPRGTPAELVSSRRGAAPLLRFDNARCSRQMWVRTIGI
jgi:hypothetical protein